jgi:hypothetical protein
MNLLKENLTNEMFHSVLSAIDTSHNGLKIFIFFFCLLASAFASYTTLTLILSYLDYGVTTTSRLISDSSVEFPKVTICNINPFQTKYAFDLLNTFSKQANMSFNILDKNQFKSFNYKAKRELFNGFKAFSMGMVSNFPNEKKQRIGHRLDDILLSCRYNYKGNFLTINDQICNLLCQTS